MANDIEAESCGRNKMGLSSGALRPAGRSGRPFFLAVLLLAFSGASYAGSAARSRSGTTPRDLYSKQEYRIPMRDGVRLFTAVYTPRDGSQKYPLLITRTPYSCIPYGEENYRNHLGPSDSFSDRSYIFVYQDVRGCYRSEGTFVNMRPMRAAQASPSEIDESTDTWDTIEWLLHHVKNNNGRAGLWGISYPGFYAAAALVRAHPALVAVSPQAPIADWFLGDDFHHNGAFFLPHAFNFLSSFGRPRRGLTSEAPPAFQHGTPDGYRFFLQMGPLSNANEKHLRREIPFWDEIMAHENYDSFWKQRSLLPHLRETHSAVMTVGGWFDAENLFGPLQIYQALERRGPGMQNSLVMGPWSHGGWSQGDGSALGDLQFGSATSRFYQENIELPFFEAWLKRGTAPDLPEAWVFETGLNQWRRFSRWPPAGAEPRRLYLQPGEKISFDLPAPSAAPPFDEYVSDPRRPVPFLNQIAIGMSYEYMASDQRFAATRPDVLSYESPELSESLTVAGPMPVSLLVSTTGTDSDWIVKLIDKFPDGGADLEAEGSPLKGCQALIRGDVFRGRFRKSFEHPEAMVPGEPTRIEFVLQDIFHTFQPGHRIIVQVQSSWFPLVDRNPQKFVSIRNAREEDFQKSTQRVYSTAAQPSYVSLPVLAAP